jgi:hypothetical protein
MGRGVFRDGYATELEALLELGRVVSSCLCLEETFQKILICQLSLPHVP